MRAYVAELHNPRYLRRIVKESTSISQIAKKLHTQRKNVSAALLRYEIPAPQPQQTRSKLRFQKLGKLARRRQQLYHRRHREGRLRQEQIRVIARGIQEGRMKQDAIAELRISTTLYYVLSKSPLTRALLWAWGVVNLTERQRTGLMKQMVEAGFDYRAIERTLNVSPFIYANQLKVKL